MGESPSADERERRRRAAKALGDLLPEQTSDDSAPGWGDRNPDRDEDLRRDVPPHHGS